MKKRFTIMLDKNVIANIKKLYDFWTPTAIRESIEELLNNYVVEKVKELEEKYR